MLKTIKNKFGFYKNSSEGIPVAEVNHEVNERLDRILMQVHKCENGEISEDDTVEGMMMDLVEIEMYILSSDDPSQHANFIKHFKDVVHNNMIVKKHYGGYTKVNGKNLRTGGADSLVKEFMGDNYEDIDKYSY